MNASDIVVTLPNHSHVSLAALAAAGIDTGSPFLVWADRLTNTVFARQGPVDVNADRTALFADGHQVTGAPAEDPKVEYERGYDDGYEQGYRVGEDEGQEEGLRDGYSNGYAAGKKDAEAAALKASQQEP